MLSGNEMSQNNTIECSKNPDAVYAGLLLDLKLIGWYALKAVISQGPGFVKKSKFQQLCLTNFDTIQGINKQKIYGCLMQDNAIAHKISY